MLICLRCKQGIYRDEFKEYRGGKYHTYCHRALISEVYEFLSDAISAKWLMYFRLSGENRAWWRGELRKLIAEYRELSY